MREGAEPERYQRVLEFVLPDRDCTELAEQVKDLGRKLEGHWRATPYGESMEVEWTEADE